MEDTPLKTTTHEKGVGVFDLVTTYCCCSWMEANQMSLRSAWSAWKGIPLKESA
jgi:hypothetical protein